MMHLMMLQNPTTDRTEANIRQLKKLQIERALLMRLTTATDRDVNQN